MAYLKIYTLMAQHNRNSIIEKHHHLPTPEIIRYVSHLPVSYMVHNLNLDLNNSVLHLDTNT